MIDFHCHLDLYSEPLQVARECRRRGIYVLSVTTTPSAWTGTNALSLSDSRIRTALGLHPQLAHERHGELRLFDELISQTAYVGEVGLDGGPEFRPHWSVQQRVLEHILDSCTRAGGRILSVHSRRASKHVLDMLEKYPNAGTPVLHWFLGSRQDIDRANGLGCWFSVGPAMLQSDRGRATVIRMPSMRPRQFSLHCGAYRAPRLRKRFRRTCGALLHFQLHRSRPLTNFYDHSDHHSSACVCASVPAGAVQNAVGHSRDGRDGFLDCSTLPPTPQRGLTSPSIGPLSGEALTRLTAAIRLLQPLRGQPGFRGGHQVGRAAAQSTSDLEYEHERWHVLTAFNLPHMGAFNAGEVSQSFLSHALFGSCFTHRCAEGPRRHHLEGGRAPRPASLNCAFRHSQKRLWPAQLKPR